MNPVANPTEANPNLNVRLGRSEPEETEEEAIEELMWDQPAATTYDTSLFDVPILLIL